MNDGTAEWSDPVDPALLARLVVRALLAAHGIPVDLPSRIGTVDVAVIRR